MKKTVFTHVLIVCALCLCVRSGEGAQRVKQHPPTVKSVPETNEDIKIPLSFKGVIGTWSLKYSGNYGYYFSLSANYRAVVVIYLNTQSFVFKGVYTIDEKNRLKINFSEMKDEPRVAGINMHTGFLKVKSSYFLFSGYKIKRNNKETMYLEPRAVVIDGSNSDGYFEPVIKLTKNS